MAEPRKIDAESLRPRLERAYEFAALQVSATIERDPDFFPIYTKNGRWRHDSPSWTDWCAGFHAGLMWLLARRTGEPRWRQHAEHYSSLLEGKQYDREVHDLGFIFLNTYLPWFRLTGEPQLRDVLITAGRTLALRFNDRGRYLRSFVAPESLFIDIMMNVPLIFHAARESSDRDLERVALGHCDTTEQFLVRSDGSTAHEVIFDPDTGEFLREATHQGLRADSTWARGLAWSLYGFGTVFTYTGRDSDLAVAVRNGDCYIARCPPDLVPPWDFDVPAGPDLLEDSSAAAIAASGLWNLAALVDARDPTRAKRYRDATLTILESLCTDRYMAWSTPGWEGIVKHGVYHFHKNLGVDESVMWGDYFFLEAVDKVLSDTDCLATRNVLHYRAGSDLRDRSTLLAQAARILTMPPDQPSDHDELGEEAKQARRLSGIHLPVLEAESVGLVDDDIVSEETEIDDESLLESIEEEPRTVLITGACGNIGSKLRRAWADVYDLVLIDCAGSEDDPEIIAADLEVLDDDWITHFHGVDTVVHLAANSDELALWEDLIGPNLDVLSNVFHAAALAGVERLVFASSNHVMGASRIEGDGPIAVDMQPMPDGPYAITKLVGERMGRSLARAFDMTFIALRLGHIQEGSNRPENLPDEWARQMWLSNGDLVRLFDCAVEAEIEDRSFVLVNGMSRNHGMRWDLSEAAELLGYLPVDDAFAEGRG